jgi:hypothetical protein
MNKANNETLLLAKELVVVAWYIRGPAASQHNGGVLQQAMKKQHQLRRANLRLLACCGALKKDKTPLLVY